MNYFIYVVRCSDGSFYTGITTNPDRRLRQHNGLVKGGAKYTSSRRPCVFEIVSQKTFSKSEAMSIELKVKKSKRSEKVSRFLELTT